MNIVVGLFDHYHAQRSIEVLKDYGINHRDISLIAQDGNAFADIDDGDFVGYLCAFSTFAFKVREIGSVIAAGAFAHKFFLKLETGVTSSLVDALVNEGFSEMEAELYVEGIKRGDVLISVETAVLDEYRCNFTGYGDGVRAIADGTHVANEKYSHTDMTVSQESMVMGSR